MQNRIQFFTVIFQFRTSNFDLLEITITFLLQLGIFSRCRDSWHHFIKPMYKTAFVIFRRLDSTWAIPQYRSVTCAYETFSSSWSLWRNLVHHIEHVLHAFSHAHLMIVELNQEENPCAQQCAAHGDLGLNHWLLVVKAHLKPAYN